MTVLPEKTIAFVKGIHHRRVPNSGFILGLQRTYAMLNVKEFAKPIVGVFNGHQVAAHLLFQYTFPRAQVRIKQQTIVRQLRGCQLDAAARN